MADRVPRGLCRPTVSLGYIVVNGGESEQRAYGERSKALVVVARTGEGWVLYIYGLAAKSHWPPLKRSELQTDLTTLRISSQNVLLPAHLARVCIADMLVAASLLLANNPPYCRSTVERRETIDHVRAC